MVVITRNILTSFANVHAIKNVSNLMIIIREREPNEASFVTNYIYKPRLYSRLILFYVKNYAKLLKNGIVFKFTLFLLRIHFFLPRCQRIILFYTILRSAIYTYTTI